MRTAILGLIALALLSCSGSTTPADGGKKRDGGVDAGPPQPPTVDITASPAMGMINVPVTFTAAISGGTTPYLTCQWRYSAGAAFQDGNISGSSCTGTHTYTADADPVAISIEVGDSANRIGRKDFSYTVGSTTTGMGVDYVIREIQLVNPPVNNRYRPGSELRVTFKVRNTGLGAGGASKAKVFLRDFGRTSTELGTVQVPAIPAQSHQTVNGTFNISGSQAVGAYDIRVVADSDMQVTELEETNNETIAPSALAIETSGDGGP